MCDRGRTDTDTVTIEEHHRLRGEPPPDPTPPRRCEECDKLIPHDAGTRRKFCSAACKKRAERNRAKKTAAQRRSTATNGRAPVVGSPERPGEMVEGMPATFDPDRHVDLGGLVRLLDAIGVDRFECSLNGATVMVSRRP